MTRHGKKLNEEKVNCLLKHFLPDFTSCITTYKTS